MNAELRNLKREAKQLGIETNNFKVSKDSTGECTITQYGKCLSQGYGVTGCRIYAIQELISDELDRQEAHCK